MPSIRQNLLLVLTAVEAQPEEHFCLASYHCGTAFCSAGLAAEIPELQAQGLKLSLDDEDQDQAEPPYYRVEIHFSPFSATCDAMFGDYSWENVFAKRTEKENRDKNAGDSDRTVAIRRLKHQLSRHPTQKEHLPEHRADTSPKHLLYLEWHRPSVNPLNF